MKLYFAPGTCALGSHIILREVGANFDLVKVDIRAKTFSEGDYKRINPKGYVPALQLDNGETLTEGAVILQYIADLYPEKNLVPKMGTMERYRAMEWLNFISSEIHKSFSVLFNSAMPDEGKKAMIEKLQMRLAFLNDHLKTNQFILGSQFSVADAYAFNVIGWSHFLKMDITAHKAIVGFMELVGSRPSVQAAQAAEKSA